MGERANNGDGDAKYKAFRLSDRHREMLATIRDSTPGVGTDSGAVRYLIETGYRAVKRKREKEG